MAASAPVRIRRSPAPRVPRRVSGPAHRPRVEAPAPARARGRTTAAPPRAVGRVIAVSRGRLLDRLMRGRLWIPALALALMGIVFMQVSMLSMNAGIGRTVKQTSALQRENDAIRAELSRLAIANSVSDAAAGAGMVVPPAGAYYVLKAGNGDAARRAAASMTAPRPPVQASVVAPEAVTTTQIAPDTTSPAPADSQQLGQATSATAGTSTAYGSGEGATAAVDPTTTTTLTSGGGTAAPAGQD